MMTNKNLVIGVVFYIATFAHASSFTTTDISTFHCGCDVCCTVTDIPKRLSYTFDYLSNALPNPNATHIFDMVLAQNSWPPRNHYVFSPDGETLNCTGMSVFVYDSSDTSTPLIDGVTPDTHDSSTCKINFDYMLTSSQWSQDLVMVAEVNDLVGTDTVLDILQAELSTPVTDSGVYSIDSGLEIAYDDGLNGNVTFSVGLSDGIDPSCPLPTSIDLDFGTCGEVVSGVTTDAGATWSFDTPLAHYANCAISNRTEAGVIIFELDIEPIASVPVCPSVSDQEDFASNILLEVRLDENVYKEKSGDTNTKFINLDVPSFGVNSTDCDGKLLPLGKLIVNITSTINENVTDMSMTTASIGDVAFTVEKQCTEFDGTTETCWFRLVSDECISMEYVPEGEGGGCKFQSLDYMNVVVTVTDDTGREITEDLTNAEAYLDQNTVFTEEFCPVTDNTLDVSSLFDVTLEVTDPEFNDDLLLNDDVFVTLSIPALTGTDLHLVIETIVVELDDLRRVYDVEDKLLRMGFDSHPFANDGHYCSYYTPGESVQCPAFYDNPLRWNTWADNAVSSGRMTEVNGQDILDYCSGVPTENDRFIFRPDEWIFDQFEEETGVMRVEAYAKLRVCDGVAPGTRRLRALAADTKVELRETEFQNKFVRATGVRLVRNTEATTTPVDPNSSGGGGTTDVLATTSVVAVVGISFIAIILVSIIGLLISRTMSARHGYDKIPKAEKIGARVGGRKFTVTRRTVRR